jgi:hypothetical protein
MSGDTQSRHWEWLMLMVSLARDAEASGPFRMVSS